MSLYNTSNLTDSTNIVDLVEFIQLDVGVPFAELTILMLFVVSFISLRNFETPFALSSSLLIVFLSSMLFRYMGILESMWVTASFVALAVSVILPYFFRETN